jgi:hypothetical protein
VPVLVEAAQGEQVESSAPQVTSTVDTTTSSSVSSTSPLADIGGIQISAGVHVVEGAPEAPHEGQDIASAVPPTQSAVPPISSWKPQEAPAPVGTSTPEAVIQQEAQVQQSA